MTGSFNAEQLYSWIESKEPNFYLDVRNQDDFKRFHIEGPNEIELINIPYFEFLEIPESAISKLDPKRPIRVICAKEGSAQYVANILEESGFDDVQWLKKGIISWGNVLIPKRIQSPNHYEVWQFNRPGKASCSYGLVYSNQLMLFDVSKNIDYYLDFAASRNLVITKVFETHLQADYISGGAELAQQANAQFIAHSGDFQKTKVEYTPIVDGQYITFENGEGPKVLCTHSPGHTPGSTTFVIDEKFMISGDTVFIVSVGRPDLGKQVVEWSNQLYNTLKTRICVLPDNLIVLPGHYTDWSKEASSDFIIANDFGTVKSINESIYQIDDSEAFLFWVKENMRDQPEEYNIIRKVNAKFDTVDSVRAEELDLGKNQCAASAH